MVVAVGVKELRKKVLEKDTAPEGSKQTSKKSWNKSAGTVIVQGQRTNTQLDRIFVTTTANSVLHKTFSLFLQSFQGNAVDSQVFTRMSAC